MKRERLRTSVGVLLVASAGLLASCGQTTEPDPMPSASDSPTDSQEVVFVRDGTAEDNLPIFTEVTNSVWGSERRAEGRAYVDALVETGFDKSAMQVTEDLSTVGNPAESLMFSVTWGEQCLIGQVGPETGDPVTSVEAAVGEGLCLIGSTRTIDW